MPSPTRPRRNALSAGLAAGFTLLLVSALWVLFAPISLGGDFSYAIVSGDSELYPEVVDGLREERRRTLPEQVK